MLATNQLTGRWQGRWQGRSSEVASARCRNEDRKTIFHRIINAWHFCVPGRTWFRCLCGIRGCWLHAASPSQPRRRRRNVKDGFRRRCVGPVLEDATACLA